MSHAYSIMSAFTLTATNSTQYKVLLVRNPWGTTGYNSTFNKADEIWTQTGTKAQVPNGVDPTKDWNNSYFVIPISKFINAECFANYQIAHERAAEGYSTSWYDAENTQTETYYDYIITVPAKSGDLYFTVESYYAGIIPNVCTTGTYTYTQNG